jgi:hypothetical protein
VEKTNALDANATLSEDAALIIKYEHKEKS